MAPLDISRVLHDCADAIAESIVEHRGRGYSGLRETQYHLDLAADEAALKVLHGAGLRVVSEESGVTGSGEFTVVMDPIDGSTNCDHGVPFFAMSLALFDQEGLRSALVVNIPAAIRDEAHRGEGATRNGTLISPSTRTSIEGSLVSFSGLPERRLAWAQARALGAAALESCLVADGSLDWYTMGQRSDIHPWDDLGGLLVAREAGAVAGDFHGDELETMEIAPRRPVFAATPELLAEVLANGPL
jgi:fructose-1,6-bisphosphatase/inositol monophosphatase family enzyme